MRTSLIAAFVLGLTGAAHAGVLAVGDKYAELDTGVDANGKSFKLKSLAGKWIVVTVGAQWCVPCAKELPAWDDIAGSMAGKVVFVAVDVDNAVADGKAFHDQLKLKHMTRIYMPQDKSSIVARYGADHMPSTFVIDPKGVVRYVREGFEKGDVDTEKKNMTAALSKLLNP